MPNYFSREDGETQVIGSGYGGGYGGGFGGGGGFGSCFALIILVVIVLWLLFSRDGKDGNNGNYGGGYPVYPPFAPYAAYGGGNCCNSPLDCKIPMAPDMSNCEIDKDLWKVDADLWKSACETQKTITSDGDKTRAILYADKVEDLRDKLAEAYAEKSALKTQIYTDAKFDALNAKLCKDDNENDKQYYGLSRQIESIKCALDCFPKLPPVYFEGITPNTHHTDCRHEDYPRRRSCNDDCCNSCN